MPSTSTNSSAPIARRGRRRRRCGSRRCGAANRRSAATIRVRAAAAANTSSAAGPDSGEQQDDPPEHDRHDERGAEHRADERQPFAPVEVRRIGVDGERFAGRFSSHDPSRSDRCCAGALPGAAATHQWKQERRDAAQARSGSLRARFGQTAGSAPPRAPGCRPPAPLRYIAPMSRRIAIVEDEPAIRANLCDAFARHGFEAVGYAERTQAQQALAVRLPDLAIIDVGLGAEPDGGFELCRWLREHARTLPILMLSARDSEIDIVSGLRLGADDYVTKNVSFPHLLARVTALLRRVDALAQPMKSGERLVRGALVLDSARFEATWRELPVELTVTEFWMLHALA